MVTSINFTISPQSYTKYWIYANFLSFLQDFVFISHIISHVAMGLV